MKTPDDRWGTGYEQVPCFADIDHVGLKAGTGNTIAWIKVSAIAGNRSPLATAAIQFLRVNMPGKAYPYSEPGDDIELPERNGQAQ